MPFPKYPVRVESRKRPYGEPADTYIGLGANLGDRELNLRVAREELTNLGDVTGESSIYETEPWGVGEPQPAYLNQVCRLRTTMPATELMNRLLQIETKLGRNRKRQNESRPIDLDLLLYEDRVIDVPGLQVPHPRMPERAFVLAPLAEIAPELIHPISGATPGDLLRDVDASGVRVWERGLAE